MRVHFSGWTLDSTTYEVRRGADPVHLSRKGFRLLEILIDERPAAVSKERLIEMVWPDTNVEEGNLSSLIKEIRAALQDNARQPKIILTVFGYGYRFGAPASVESSSKARMESVAVLPFANAGAEDWEYVSDGISEALLNALTRIRSIRVVPRSTSFRYRSSDLDLKAAAREMRVEGMITGRVAVRDDALTIQAELVATSTDSQVWSGRYHGKSAELQILQKQMESEITAHIAQHGQRPKDSQAPAMARNSEAYHLYLRGRHQWNRRDAEGFRRAIDAFRAASEMDQGFALAHAALAEAYVVLGTRELYPPADIFPKAKQAATLALTIDPSLSAAHSATAGVQELFEWDWARAEESHQRAVDLDPNYASAAQWFALHYARRGEHAEAKRWIDRALELEPLSPIINTNAALISYLRHDYDAAIRHSETALSLAPHYEAALAVRGVAYVQIDPRRAIEVLEEAARLSQRETYTLSALASAYAAAGLADEARKIANEVTAYAASHYVSPPHLCLIQIAVGNQAAALSAFEAAAEQRSPWLSYALSEPRLDVIRDAPRFRSVIAAIGQQKRFGYDAH